jgi:hypothetical protein
MAAKSFYQLVVLDPAAGGLGETLRQTVRHRVSELGLQPDDHIRFLDESSRSDEVQWRDPLVGVYFGGSVQTSASSAMLQHLLDGFAFVLPVVDTTSSYQSKVPECLHALNGVPLDPADAQMEGIVGRLLEEFRLVRRRRAAFVSYRRTESRVVASQIFHSLEERRYRVFLDTFSVEHGRPFQEVLWGRMLDTDVLAFLHTRGALASRWVEEEFSRAAQLGLGVLNVIWPGHSPAPATDIGEPFQLEIKDFRSGPPPEDENAELTPDVVHRLAVAVEALRARAMADRRRRVVETFCRRVDAFARRTGVGDLRVVVQAAHHLQLCFGARRSVRVYPMIGHPDTTHAREASDACAVLDQKGYLIFDSNGIDAETAAHLRWLNNYLPIQSFSTTEADEWIPRL